MIVSVEFITQDKYDAVENSLIQKELAPLSLFSNFAEISNPVASN